MNQFCTIITKNYLKYALALHQSIGAVSSSFVLFVLIVDSEESDGLKKHFETDSFRIIEPSELKQIEIGKQIFDKYYKETGSQLRWALKPVLLQLILSKYKAKKVIYVDPDIYFAGNPDYLFDLLEANSILLNPHNRSIEPAQKNNYMIATLRQGMFNAGFIGVNSGSFEFLNWWAAACLYRCEKNTAFGFYDDQRYLDFVPLYFKDVFIVKHPGVNIAEWNLRNKSPEFELKNDKLMLNGEPAIFFHLTTEKKGTISFLRELNNKSINRMLDGYSKLLSDFETKITQMGFSFKSEITTKDKFRSLIRMIRIRTRLRKFMEG